MTAGWWRVHGFGFAIFSLGFTAPITRTVVSLVVPQLRSSVPGYIVARVLFGFLTGDSAKRRRLIGPMISSYQTERLKTSAVIRPI